MCKLNERILLTETNAAAEISNIHDDFLRLVNSVDDKNKSRKPQAATLKRA
jgi:hypothetical protein